jgi:hypothetical protein
MARIRTVKPELWTDPEFVECSPNARLLFVAALNFASDYGVLPDKPKQLRMQCLPADDVSIDELVTELVDHGFWERRIAPDGAKVLVIRTFKLHQKVDKPTLGRWGDPATWTGELPEPSPSAPRIVPESSPTEGKGREGIFSAAAEPSPPKQREPDPLYTALVSACGWSYDEMTKRQRTACGVARSELVKVGATPDEVKARATVYVRKFPGVVITPSALASNWAGIAPNGRNGSTVQQIGGANVDTRNW